MANTPFNPNVHTIDETRQALMRVQSSIVMLDTGGSGGGGKGNVFCEGGATEHHLLRVISDAVAGDNVLLEDTTAEITDMGALIGVTIATSLLTGTLQAAQFPALTGDVTTVAGALATTIASDAVTFAKMQNISTDRLIGRDTAGTGDPEEISVGGGIEFTGSAAIQRSAFAGGDVTASAGSAVLTIANDAVTFAKFQNISAASSIPVAPRVLGRVSTSPASADMEQFVMLASGVLSWTLDSTSPGSETATIAIGNVTTDRLLGRDTAGTGAVEQISVTGGLEFTGSTSIQRSALTGDVTASAGSNTTVIANDTVTFAKLQNITTDRLLGRDTAGTGDVEEISVGGGLEFTGSTSIQRSALTGDVTATAGSNATTIANDAVTTAKMANTTPSLSGTKVLGRLNSGSGDPEYFELFWGAGIAFTTDTGTLNVVIATDPDNVTIENSGTTFRIKDDGVTFAKIQNITTDRLLGRDTAGTGNTEEITVGGGLEFTGSTGIQRSALTGDVTASAGSNATTIANDAVTFAKMLNATAESVLIGRGQGSGAGDFQEIVLGTNLSMSGTTLNAAGGASTPSFVMLAKWATDGKRSILPMDILYTTGSGSVVLATSPTIVTPTIAATDWTNANHNHTSASRGGTLTRSAIIIAAADRVLGSSGSAGAIAEEIPCFQSGRDLLSISGPPTDHQVIRGISGLPEYAFLDIDDISDAALGSGSPDGTMVLWGDRTWDSIATTDLTGFPITVAQGGTGQTTEVDAFLVLASFSVHFTGILSPAAIAAQADNYAPTGHGDVSALRITLTGSQTITGLAGGADGRVLFIHNIDSADTLTLADENASSTDVNRFALSSNVTLAPDQSALLWYDATTQRWRAISGSSSGSSTVSFVTLAKWMDF